MMMMIMMFLKSLSTRLQVNEADQGVHLLLGSFALVGFLEQTLLDHLVHLEERGNEERESYDKDEKKENSQESFKPQQEVVAGFLVLLLIIIIAITLTTIAITITP